MLLPGCRASERFSRVSPWAAFAIGTLAFDTPKQIDGWHDEVRAMQLAALHFTRLALVS